MKKQKTIEVLEKYIYLPLIAVLVTIIAQQYFFAPNQRTKQRIELKRELLKDQYFSLQKMHRMAEIGESTVLFKLYQVYLDEEKKIIGKDEEGIVFRMPEIALDKDVQKEWFLLKEEVISYQEVINPEIYSFFQSLLTIIKNNPFPDETSKTSGFETSMLQGYENSLWTNKEFIGRWLALNNHLKIKIEKLMNLID